MVVSPIHPTATTHAMRAMKQVKDEYMENLKKGAKQKAAELYQRACSWLLFLLACLQACLYITPCVYG
jgi:hypothetical protein